MELTRRHWLRATVISVVLLIHGIFAMPRPQRIKTKDLKSPEVRDEIGRWADVLGTDFDTLAAFVVDFTEQSANLQRGLRAPFRPTLRFFGVGQAWAMFATPDSWPHRLEVHTRVGGEWKSLYRRWDADPWRNGALRNRRVRGIYDAASNNDSTAYWNFTRWVAKQAFLDHPDATEVRVRMIRTHTVLPGALADSKLKERLVRTHQRSAILPDDGLVP